MTLAPPQELSLDAERLCFYEARVPWYLGLGAFVFGAMEGGEVDLETIEPGRTVDLLTDVNQHSHALRLTQASRLADDGSAPVCMMFPGFTMTHDLGGARSFHDAISEDLPDHTVVSVATDGTGLASRPLNAIDLMHRSFRTMAADRLAIAKAIAGRRPVVGVNVSMGTVLGTLMAHQNLQLAPVNCLNLTHLIQHSPGLVTEDRVWQDAVLGFGAHIGGEVVRESVRMPWKVAAYMLGSAALFAKQATSHALSAREMLNGTPEAVIEEVVSQVPTTIMYGARDSLLHLPMFSRLQAAYPHNLSLMEVPQGGHLATAYPETEAKRVAFAQRQCMRLAA